MKDTDQYFPVVLFIMLYKVISTSLLEVKISVMGMGYQAIKARQKYDKNYLFVNLYFLGEH